MKKSKPKVKEKKKDEENFDFMKTNPFNGAPYYWPVVWLLFPAFIYAPVLAFLSKVIPQFSAKKGSSNALQVALYDSHFLAFLNNSV